MCKTETEEAMICLCQIHKDARAAQKSSNLHLGQVEWTRNADAGCSERQPSFRTDNCVQGSAVMLEPSQEKHG